MEPLNRERSDEKLRGIVIGVAPDIDIVKLDAERGKEK